jgi:hypothetical protein
MRHDFLPSAVAARPRGMGQTPATAPLVAPAGGALRVAAGFLRTAPRAVDLAAITAAADQNLSATAGTEKEPGWRCLNRFGPVVTAWTKATLAGIMPRHSCLHDCGARRRVEAWQFRSAPCLPSNMADSYRASSVVSEHFQCAARFAGAINGPVSSCSRPSIAGSRSGHPAALLYVAGTQDRRQDAQLLTSRSVGVRSHDSTYTPPSLRGFSPPFTPDAPRCWT